MLGNHQTGLGIIKEAIENVDSSLVYEIVDKPAFCDKVSYADPHEFYEVLLSAINSFGIMDNMYDNLIIRLLIEAKEEHFGLFDGKSLLMSALNNRVSYEIIDSLINAGSDVNAISNDNNMTPLLYALKAENDQDIIAELINRGADVNCRDCEGSTPLFYGMEYYYNNPDLIEVLLEAGSNVHDLDCCGRNILMIGKCQCLDGHHCEAEESIDLLLKYGIGDADLKHTDNDGNTILHTTDCEYLFKLAMKCGVSVNAKNNEGQTPLLKVPCQNYEKRVVHLLKCGANIHSTDSQLKTVLHFFIWKVELSLILNDPISPCTLDMLLYYGGSMFARNSYNQTPLDLFIEKEEDYYREFAFACLKHIIPFDVNEFSFEKKVLEKLFNIAGSRSFIVSCKLELSLMQETFISDGLTFYEFCILKLYYKSKCMNISPYKYNYSYSEIRQLFPIYGNVIIIRIKDNRLKKQELDLRKIFEQITLRPVDSVKTDFSVDLNYDCLYHISRYLNYKEMFNIFSAAIES